MARGTKWCQKTTGKERRKFLRADAMQKVSSHQAVAMQKLPPEAKVSPNRRDAYVVS
jgi:hypothetical protein